MEFTQLQIKSIIDDVVSKKDGLNAMMKMTLEALMRSERTEHNMEVGDYRNGYRTRKVFGDKHRITFVL